MAKENVYFIDAACKERQAKRIFRDMKRCSTIVVLGNDSTPQMAREESIARAMRRPIWYRPNEKTLEELMLNGKQVFPK